MSGRKKKSRKKRLYRSHGDAWYFVRYNLFIKTNSSSTNQFKNKRIHNVELKDSRNPSQAAYLFSAATFFFLPSSTATATDCSLSSFFPGAKNSIFVLLCSCFHIYGKLQIPAHISCYRLRLLLLQQPLKEAQMSQDYPHFSVLSSICAWFSKHFFVLCIF